MRVNIKNDYNKTYIEKRTNFGEAGNEALKKIVLSVTTAAVVGLGSAFFSHTVQAETINELETKQSNIKNEREEVKENLSKAEAEIADVLFDLKEINEEIEKVEKSLKENKSMMNKTSEKIEESKEEIKDLEKEIEKLEEAIDVRNELLKERIASMQKAGGNVGFLEVVFGSQSFEDFISRASSASKVTKSDAELIEQQEKDKQKVEEQRGVYQAKLDEQEEQKVELEGMKELIVTQKEENEKSKKKLKAKEKELVTMKSELESKDSNLASLEAEIRDDIEAARTPTVTASESNASSNENSSNESNNSSDNSSDGDLRTLSQSEPTENSTNNKPEEKQQQQPAPKPSGGTVDTIMSASKPHLGTPYTWGGKSPSGFDCSGYVSWAYGQTGKSIPSSTSALQSTGTKIPYSSIQPGDLVFFDTYKTNGHVGIYVGNGNFIGAQNSTGLAIANMESGYWKQHFSGHVRRVQ